MRNTYVIIFITTSGVKEARRIARALLEKKLVACANIVGRITSYFWWKHRIDTAHEALIIAKSKKSRMSPIIKTVKAMHSYDVCEIIAAPIVAGSKAYLDWIDESLR